MRSIPPALALLALCVSSSALARGTIDKIQLKGLDDDSAIVENIQASLSLYQAVGKQQGESRLEYLLSQAEAQTRTALEPFGYYNPKIGIEAPREGDHLTVIISIDKGEPVRVRKSSIHVENWAEDDKYLQQDLKNFQPKPGDVFDHTSYEASKLVITRRLSERGYFDADFTQRRVEITRAENAADIDLTWDSGRRYDMGEVRFQYDYFRPGLFNPLVYWDEGSYYHEGKLDRLRESLTKLDYFSTIDIQPKPEEADDQGRVPVEVKLERAKRTIYTAGLSYGTESGPGVRGGMERRYINDRGHKLDSQLDYALKRKSLTETYKIPAFDWLDGWYLFSGRLYDEQTKYIDLRNIKLTAARSGQINRYWTAIASVNALRERWRYSAGSEHDFTSQYQSSTLLYPQLDANYVNVDDRTLPRHGIAANMMMRSGLSGVGSDASFVQAQAKLRWFLPAGADSRMILRGEAGSTWTSDLLAMPPSLRFFAGGDDSVRGYAYREVGPRTPKPDEFALGAKSVVTLSAEYEHYFNGGPIGGAVFIDSGSAFDDTPDWHTGIGFGVRYRSPVGPVRVDIAHGLDDPDSIVQLYINIGANL